MPRWLLLFGVLGPLALPTPSRTLAQDALPPADAAPESAAPEPESPEPELQEPASEEPAVSEPGSPELEPEEGDEVAEVPEAPPAEEGRARIFEGTLALTVLGLHIRTRVDQRQSFYGPALELNGFLGPHWGFLANLGMYFPMRARQIGEAGNLTRSYDRNLGFDVVLGVGVHRDLPHGLTLTVGPGVHVNTLDLNDPDLVRANSITMGVGGVAWALWTWHNALVFGANAKLAMDFVDLIHDTGKLAVGFVWSVGLSAGLQFD